MKGDKIYYQEGFKYQLKRHYTVFVGIGAGETIETDYIRLSPNGYLTIKKGYAWDGASGPTIDTPDTMRGSLVHDALYQLMRLELLPELCRPQADRMLHDICLEDGMSDFRADIWVYLVDKFAAGAAKAGTDRPVITAP